MLFLSWRGLGGRKIRIRVVPVQQGFCLCQPAGQFLYDALLFMKLILKGKLLFRHFLVMLDSFLPDHIFQLPDLLLKLF